jgi:hypothetical protein
MQHFGVKRSRKKKTTHLKNWQTFEARIANIRMIQTEPFKKIKVNFMERFVNMTSSLAKDQHGCHEIEKSAGMLTRV